MNRQRVVEAITNAERAYAECWSILVAWRTRHDASALLRFQPLLAETLLALSRVHEALAARRAELIRRKGKVQRDWFVRRQRTLARSQKLIADTIAIGRLLGDSFAWFFYQFDPALMEQHAREQRAEFLPGGVGGRGEVEFIKRFPRIGKLMVLYHGVTTFLRLGDVSLIDMRTMRVAALAELKSCCPEPGGLRLTLQAIAVGDESPFGDSLEVPTKRAPRRQLPDWVEARLRRQTKRMATALGARTKAPRQEQHLRFDTHVEAVSRLVRAVKPGRALVAELAPGLQCMVCRSQARSLHGRMAEDSPDSVNLGEALAKVRELVRKSASPESKHNGLYLATLPYYADGRSETLVGAMPLFWQIEAGAMRDLAFRKVFIVTIYNPVRLLDGVERAGFDVIADANGGYRISKRVGDHVMEIHGFDHFLNIVRLGLVREPCVAEAIDRFIEVIGTQPSEKPTRWDLRLAHMMGPPGRRPQP